MKQISPLRYRSRQNFINDTKTTSFYLIPLGFIVSIVTIICLCVVLENVPHTKDNKLILELTFLGIMIISAVSLVCTFGSISFYEELIERLRIKKYPNYQPLKPIAFILNDIVELDNGQLFRLYQFIKPEESSVVSIAYELPENTKCVHSCTFFGDSIKEQTCMFEELDEYELGDILTPINQYYIDKEERERLRKRQHGMKSQSEIKHETIENLPLFKGLKKLELEVKKEINETNIELRK
ncbi:hypothetical protein [Staphylococcus hyicus]|uniref:hypothetical protein n=1 Tax=Staphylococcus hyicus TaxID=1284 RepID=UPI003132E292